MLLRSSSTPIQNSWLPQYCGKESFSPEPEFRILQRSRSFDSSSSTKNRMTKKQAFSSETSLHKKNTKLVKMAPPSPSPSLPDSHNNKKETDQEKEENIQWLLSSSGLGEKVLFNNDYDRKEEEEFGVQAMVTGGGGVGRAGGKICGTGGVSDGGGGSGSVEKYNNNHNNNNYNSNNLGSYSTDAYYQKMIEANPDNSLLLGNYAKFLKEVKGDYARAEEYCGRAILSNPGDGDMLSVYADLIWRTQKDAERAESYFDQAVKTSPGDCYVLASYARFLWDAEEEVEEGKDNETSRYGTEASHVCPPDSFHGVPHLPSLTAAT